MNKQNNERTPLNLGTILIRTAAVLFCLLMVSVYMMSGLFARYVSTGQGGDSARVAGFDVEVNGPDGVEIVYAQELEDYNLTVINNSEVAVTYDVKVLVDKLNFEIGVKLGDQMLSTTGETEVDFGNIGSLAPGATGVHPLTFEVVNWNQFTQLVDEASREETVDFTVYIDVVQVD